MGAAAQGAEEGEIRPLTTMPGESMRRRCVPGSEAAWGALRRTEASLTGEVDVFEGRKAVMGVTEADPLPSSPAKSSTIAFTIHQEPL